MANMQLAIDILARDKATATLDKVSGSIGRAAKVGSFLGSAAGNLAASGLASVKAFATGSVDAFAAVEDATSAAGVTFGSFLPTIESFATSAAKNFGLSKREALDAANTFGTFGKAAGLGGEDLAHFSTKLTGLAGDLSSFKGTTTEQSIEAVGAALRGEAEPIRAYGVLLDEAALKAQAMSLGLLKATKDSDKIKQAHTTAQLALSRYNETVKKHGKNSDEAKRAGLALEKSQTALKKATEGTLGPLTSSQKILAAEAAIYAQTKDAQGDYRETANSTANTQKTLAKETENAQAKLGQKLAPALTAVRQAMLVGIRSLSGFATGVAAASAFVDEHSTALKVVAGIMTAILLPTIARVITGMIATGTAAVASAAKQTAAWLAVQVRSLATVAVLTVSYALTVAGWVGAGIAAVANAALVVGAWVLMGAQATLQAVRMAAAWIIALGPVAWITAAVIGLGVLIFKNWDLIKEKTVAAWNAVWGKVKDVIGFMKNLFLNFTGPGLLIKHWDSIVNTIKGLPGRIKGAAAGMFDGIKDAFRGALNWIIGKWNGLQFSLPSVSAFGKTIGGSSFGVPKIPLLAHGGHITRGGLAVVGDRGPELMEMQRGATVTPLDRGTGGMVVNIIFQGPQDPMGAAREVEKILTNLSNTRGTPLSFRTKAS